MRLLVCGGRDFKDGAAVMREMKRLNPSFVITGGAPGADKMADEWAAEMGVPRVIYPANWTGDGKAAGPIRNARMISWGKPDVVLAFPGGKGTADMISRAARAGIRVVRANTERG